VRTLDVTDSRHGIACRRAVFEHCDSSEAAGAIAAA